VVREHQSLPAGPANLPDHRVGFPQGLGWSWREPRVRGESGSLRPPAGARHHRGDPRRFGPYIDLYRRALTEFGHGELPIAVHSPGYVAQSDEQAREELWPYYKEGRDRIGATRGWPPVTRAQFDQEASVDGSLYVGSAETVAAKIARTVASLDIDRFDLKYSSGRLPHQKLMRNIELYGTQVVPKVREILAEESALLAG
jgi:alkanesulfonate monooxygenase SsuD/methylene tetrahydromethanopterin reductase-like flavin-dependent oxidoreductase (luciferase family)